MRGPIGPDDNGRRRTRSGNRLSGNHSSWTVPFTGLSPRQLAPLFIGAAAPRRGKRGRLQSALQAASASTAHR